MYALNLNEDGRILSATYPEYALDDAVIVENLPEGNVYEYRYVDCGYVYDPLPTPEVAEADATTDDVLNALLGVTER